MLRCFRENTDDNNGSYHITAVSRPRCREAEAPVPAADWCDGVTGPEGAVGSATGWMTQGSHVVKRLFPLPFAPLFVSAASVVAERSTESSLIVLSSQQAMERSVLPNLPPNLSGL